MLKLKLRLISAAILALTTPAAFAATLTNGTFENGLQGWSTIGDVTIASADPTPLRGETSAIITSGQTASGDFAVSRTLGLQNIALNVMAVDLTGDLSWTASAIYRTIDVVAGQTLLFDFKVLAIDSCPFALGGTGCNNVYENLAAFSFSLAGAPTFLYGTDDPDMARSTQPGIKGESSLQSYAYTFQSTGTATIGFIMLNTGDASATSALQLDNVRLASVPLPASALLLGIGILGLGAFRRRALA